MATGDTGIENLGRFCFLYKTLFQKLFMSDLFSTTMKLCIILTKTA